MTLLQPPPYPLPSVPERIEVTEPSQATPEPTPAITEPLPQPLITDLISSIAATEETLAAQRNQLRRRVNTEPLTAKQIVALATLASDGEARARVARKRYRSVELAMIYRFPSHFNPTKRFDWRIGGNACLKLALSRASNGPQHSLDEAIDILTPEELESYSYLRRRALKAKTVKAP
jgi:hypothetical protein